MAEILFTYKGIETSIQSNIDDKMEEIINKYVTKSENISKKIYFVYNEERVNKELTFSQQANEIDNERKKMNILVFDEEKEENFKNLGNMIKSNEIVCPECNENILINVKNYKINLKECKNGHIKNDILFEVFENNQKIDLSKIKCDKCNEKSINNTYNNEFYICNSCEIKLCPSCKSIHDNDHNIINYNDRNYICKKHNDKYVNYCKECKENICMLCESDHNNHKKIYLGDMIYDKDDLLKKFEEFEGVFGKLKIKIEEIKNKLNYILKNIEIYYNINKDIINYYENKKKNYYLLKNINEIEESNKNIIKDLNKINEEENIIKRFDYLMNIYGKINTFSKT